MLDQTEAEARAKAFLADQSRAWPTSNVRIIPEDSFIDGSRFIALYDSVDFLDHGVEGAQLGGNLPISVDLETGECSFITWQETNDLMDRGLI